jgi:hypothetical protein
MKITRLHLEIYNPETRDINDRRRKISKAVFSYISENGDEFRKSFTDKPNTPELKFWDIAPKIINIKN